MNAPVNDSDARERLQLEAMKLFAAHGLDGTTTRMISEATDLNVSLISYYFGGKEGLYKAILQKHVQDVQLQAQGIFELTRMSDFTKETFVRLLSMVADTIIRENIEHPEMKNIVFREMTAGMPHAKEIFNEVFEQLGQAFMAFVELGKQKKFIRHDLNSRLFIMMFIHSLDFYIMSSRCDSHLAQDSFKLPQQSEDLRNHVIKILLEGSFTK